MPYDPTRRFDCKLWDTEFLAKVEETYLEVYKRLTVGKQTPSITKIHKAFPFPVTYSVLQTVRDRLIRAKRLKNPRWVKIEKDEDVLREVVDDPKVVARFSAAIEAASAEKAKQVSHLDERPVLMRPHRLCASVSWLFGEDCCDV